MRVTKCDLCKKEIKKGDKPVHVYFEFYNDKELCEKCGDPILKFLKNKKLFKEKTK